MGNPKDELSEVKLITKNRFLNFFKTRKGWEFVSRKENPWAHGNHKADAVVIVPLVVQDGKLRLVLTEEWREPFQEWILGLPAGLVDEGESYKKAATRELREETGLTPIGPWGYLHETPKLFSSEGMTDEAVVTVYLACEGNISDKYLQDNEKIKTFTIDRKGAIDLVGGHPEDIPNMGKVVYYVLQDFAITNFEWLFGDDEIGRVFGGK